MRNSTPIRLTSGVRLVDDGYLFAEAGIFVSSHHPRLRSELLDAGFASEISSPWWRSRSFAIVLAPDVSAAPLRSLIHNLRGMLRTIIILVFLTTLSITFNNVGTLGICIAAAIFLASILLHEAGHVFAFRFVAPRRYAILVSAGLRCHMVRPALEGWREITVVIAGPIAPMLPTIGFLLYARSATFVVYVWGAIALGHVLLLLIPIGDGANLHLAIFHRKT